MNEENEKIYNKLLLLFATILVLFVAFVCFIFIGIAKVDAASYSSYIWEEPSYLQFKNISNTTLAQCNNSDVCFYTGGNDAVGAYINYAVSNIDTPPMAQKSYKVSIEFTLTSLIATSVSTSSSAHSMQMQVRNSATGAYTTATCDGSESLTITTDTSTTRVKYNCSKLNVSSTVYIMAMNYRYTPPTNYALPYWTTITMEQNLAVIDLSDPNQSVIDSQIAAANSIITNNDKNTEKLLDEIEKNNQAIKDTGDKIVNSQNKTNDTLDSIEDSILDSNTSSSSSSLNGFFGSFNNNDNGGLSAIITAPLVAINKTLDNTCPSLDGSYKGQSFSIPSGCVFWNRIPEVKELANVISGGFLCYLILRKMFLLIHQLKDPTDDRVEVMNL